MRFAVSRRYNYIVFRFRNSLSLLLGFQRYTLGKALTFQKLVCTSCPLQAADLDRTRAESLRASLEARDASVKPGTPDDQYILVLCPGDEAAGCDNEVDEQELVHFYLTRRFRL